VLDYLKKSILTGVGMALRSKKEIEALAKEFAEQSEMNQQEARDFLEECQTKRGLQRPHGCPGFECFHHDHF